jgi:hypothetical protein
VIVSSVQEELVVGEDPKITMAVRVRLRIEVPQNLDTRVRIGNSEKIKLEVI